MSRLSQAIDYLNIKPSKLSQDYIKCNYTSLTITPELKKERRKYLKKFNNQ